MPADDPDTPLEAVRFLARAESRVRVLEYLAASEPATQRDLRTELDASRTTVSRAVGSLVEAGWVEHRDREYRLTRVGRIVAEEFSSMLDAMASVTELRPFLRWLPADVAVPDFHDADDVTVTVSTDADPYAPARKQAEILDDADRLRILLPSIGLEATRTITEQVTRHGLEVETVVPRDLEATLESDEFAPLLREKVATGRSTVLVASADLPFYLGLADDGRVQVGVEDDDGFPRALLETTDADVREWAESVYRDYRDGARPKPVAEF